MRNFIAILTLFAWLWGEDSSFVPNLNHSISVLSENDAYFEPFVTTDRYYTAGHYLSYLSPESSESVLNNIAALAYLANAHFTRFALSLSQEINTPQDKYSTPPPRDDLPYSANLYASLGFLARGELFMEQFRLDLGVVGRYALGKEAQNGVHKITNNRASLGWDYQLKNEFLFNLHYGAIYRWVFIEDFFDMLPFFQISLGTAYTAAQVGIRARLGYGLRHDFGLQRLKSRFFQNVVSDGFKIYVIFGMNGSAVARDMAIQGNAFGGTKSALKLTPLLYEIEAGAMIGYKYFSLGYIWSKEATRFHTQKGMHSYGSIRLEIIF